MSESKFVTAVNSVTGLVSGIPAHYLDLYPEYKEVSENEVIELRRADELKLFGEYKTPAPKAKAHVKEGGK